MLWLPEGLSEFSTVRETAFVNPAAHSQIAASSPDRVLLMVACNVTTQISTSTTAGTNQGVFIVTTNLLVTFTWNTHGPLTNAAWYVVPAVVGTVTVFEVFYRPQGR